MQARLAARRLVQAQFTTTHFTPTPARLIAQSFEYRGIHQSPALKASYRLSKGLQFPTTSGGVAHSRRAMLKLLGLGQAQAATAETQQQERSADGPRSLPSSEQLQELIRSRRSIMPTKFTGEAVDRAKLEQMLEAANWAPSHKLTEPWRFVVLGGDAKKEFEEMTIRLCGQKLEGDKAEQVMAKLRRKADTTWPKVHCYIALCMKRNASKLPEWEELCAVASAVQNLWLTATALDVAGYWSSWQEAARDDPEMMQFLGLDAAAGDRCLGVFVTGISDSADSCRGSRKPIEQKVDWRL